MNLKEFKNSNFQRGRSKLIEAIWVVVQAVFINSWLPGSSLKIWILRLFGAKIGKGVVIKSHVRIKFPWKLVIGDYSWIGESVWIDNLDKVSIGNNCCISQGSYLCTGSHDWKSPNFDLKTKEIRLEDHVWLCAKSVIAPGTIVGEGAILTLGSVATESLPSLAICSGNPAKKIKTRISIYLT